MTPPHFQIGQEVEIIGPDKLGCEFDLERFIISMLWKDDQMYYSAEHQPWYPASSLRLVEDLQVGDWVEVIGPHCDIFIARCDDLKIFKIEYRLDTGCYGYDSGRPSYPAKSLRKLTPDEIAMHTGTVGYKMQECQEKLDEAEEALRKVLAPLVDKRLSAIDSDNEIMQKRLTAIESRLNKLGPSHAELLGDVEAIAERIAANEKRLAILEGERPEVISDNHPKDQIHVIIKKMGCKEHQLITYNLRIAKEWCIDVLDSMKET